MFLKAGDLSVINKGIKFTLRKGDVEIVNNNKNSAAFSQICYLLNFLFYIELSRFSTNFCPYYYYY